jgi:hypothetical protein
MWEYFFSFFFQPFNRCFISGQFKSPLVARLAGWAAKHDAGTEEAFISTIKQHGEEDSARNKKEGNQLP